ncbi:ABC transporter permease [Boudabousia liubingyangii]|uniref:ABC transporter permease n=1 Tax=Boudabousia liubingyangii TaxID=1921764 RepID=A0A1Q5PQY6_9ACTO|nr:ABC transporter permease [Boudabousia liubingyangii]OKL49882.1 ABC transporter permease [Boudabousia liubingyangii]
MRYWIRTVLVLGLTAIVMLPLYYIFVSTFKTQTEMALSPFALPKSFSLENYKTVFTSLPVGQAFLNTIIVTVSAVAFQVFIGSLAAYGMILRKTWFTSAVGAVLLVGFTIPVQATLIPIYRMEAHYHLTNSLKGLIIVYLGSAVFCYFLIVGYMRKLPMELIEAARIDGAGPWTIYWRIVLPLIRPILTTVVVFQTLATWNDFLWPNILLSSGDRQTIVLQVFNAVGEFSTDWPLFMTITVIALVPVMIFFVFTQRWIVAGLISGSVKG